MCVCVYTWDSLASDSSPNERVTHSVNPSVDPTCRPRGFWIFTLHLLPAPSHGTLSPSLCARTSHAHVHTHTHTHAHTHPTGTHRSTPGQTQRHAPDTPSGARWPDPDRQTNTWIITGDSEAWGYANVATGRHHRGLRRPQVAAEGEHFHVDTGERRQTQLDTQI